MFNLFSRSCVPLWLPCQFLCCRVSHFLLFVCAGGCQARWNAAEVILGGTRLGPRPGLYMTCLTPRCSPTPCRLEQACLAAGRRQAREGSRAEDRSTLLLQLACAGVVCPTPCRVRRRKGIESKLLELWAAVLPGEGEQRCVQPLAGEGDLVCLSSCLTSSDLDSRLRLPCSAD